MSQPAILAPIDGSLITDAAFTPKDRPYQMCVHCVMDTTDPAITFDSHGVCSHCNYFEDSIKPAWPAPDVGAERLAEMIKTIKAAGEGKRYDCIIGISGGVDSSFIATKVAEWGLRPLAVHVDAGWNSETAVMNIEQLCKRLGLDLLTHVIDWEDMQDVQLAFLRSNLANQDTPQDHVFTAAVAHHAEAEGIRYVISGSNYATESILPSSWGYDAMDTTLLKAIHARYGKRRLTDFPFVPFTDIYPLLGQRRIVVSPLNFIHYDKDEAIKTLEKDYGWRYYGGKHYESKWTRFFQAYYLPHKFGYDKRKAHLSSLIMSGQMSREQALAELSKPLYETRELNEDKIFIAKKLGIELAELESLIAAPLRQYTDYPNFQGKIKRYQQYKQVKAIALLPLRIVRRLLRMYKNRGQGAR